MSQNSDLEPPRRFSPMYISSFIVGPAIAALYFGRQEHQVSIMAGVSCLSIKQEHRNQSWKPERSAWFQDMWDVCALAQMSWREVWAWKTMGNLSNERN